MGEFSVIYLKTNFLYFMEHTSGHYWFYDPVMLQKHVFAQFARAQLCISSFAWKPLCRISTLLAEVNSCINFNFCSTIITI